ncbi:autophagy-related protein 27 [Trichophaea hybrida]|nr:autophagy-related protein 27 [Trichophaea hybrida]
MWLPSPLRGTAAALLLPTLISAAGWDCKTPHNGLTYDFTSLGGKHELTTTENTHPNVRNTTWQIDPCKALPKAKEGEKEKEQCPSGTYVCAQRRFIHDGKAEFAEWITIAGEFDDHKLNETATLFDVPDQKKSGVRITLHGPKYVEKYEQSAVIDFVCDMERTGLEGSKAVDAKAPRMRRRDDKKEEEPSLKYVSYSIDETMVPKQQTLRLEWRTKQACEEYAKKVEDDKKDKDSSSSWGFFTWIFIIFFLGMAAYLIFGSWINYNRYGARGWDLLPHNDTIRDIPYLLQDFMRRVVRTLQGRNSYSAI